MLTKTGCGIAVVLSMGLGRAVYAVDLDVSSGSHTIQDGDTFDNVDARGTSTVEMTGGTVTNDAESSDDAVFTITGGTVADRAQSFNSSTFNLQGGTVWRAWSNDVSTYTMTGGTVEETVSSFNQSTFTLTGGTVLFEVSSEDDSRFTMTGGTVEGISAEDSSLFTMTGGQVVNHFGVSRNAQVILKAQQFFYDDNDDQVSDAGFDFGGLSTLALDRESDVFSVSGQQNVLPGLTVQWGDGSTASFDFLFATSQPVLWQGALTLQLIPEPSAFMVIGLASALGLIRRPRSRSYGLVDQRR